jgi:hypothetical protein
MATSESGVQIEGLDLDLHIINDPEKERERPGHTGGSAHGNHAQNVLQPLEI